MRTIRGTDLYMLAMIFFVHHVYSGMLMIFNVVKDILSTLSRCVVWPFVAIAQYWKTRWRDTVFLFSFNKGRLGISLPEWKTRSVKGLLVNWYLPWDKECRRLALYVYVRGATTHSYVFCFIIPFVYGFRFELCMTEHWWNKWVGVGQPHFDQEYGFTFNDQFIAYVRGSILNRRSWEFMWRQKLHNLIHSQRGVVREDTGWYNALVPLPEVGDFKKETIRMLIRRIEIETIYRDWFRRKRVYQTLFTVDIPDGVVVPARYNVYQDEIITGRTFRDVKNHPDAVRKLTDMITESRKLRPRKL